MERLIARPMPDPCALVVKKALKIWSAYAVVGEVRHEIVDTEFFGVMWGQDIAEYAVMLAVTVVLVVGTIRLVGSSANNAFSSLASTMQ